MSILSDLKSMRTEWISRLVSDDWDVEEIATAAPDELTTYKGIGKATAKRLIDEAREIVNSEAQAKEAALQAAEAAARRAGSVVHPVTGVTAFQARVSDNPASTRVQRIREAAGS